MFERLNYVAISFLFPIYACVRVVAINNYACVRGIMPLFTLKIVNRKFLFFSSKIANIKKKIHCLLKLNAKKCFSLKIEKQTMTFFTEHSKTVKCFFLIENWTEKNDFFHWKLKTENAYFFRESLKLYIF